MSTVTKHFPIGPSSMARCFACPGSLALCRGIESEGTNYSREGDAAHAYAAAALLGDFPSTPRLCNRCNSTLTTPPCLTCGASEYHDDEGMARHIDQYLDFINDLRLNNVLIVEGIEDTIESESIKDFGGTVDYWAFYMEGDTSVLHIVDLKYGAGVGVYVEANPQLLSYAWLVRERFQERQFDEIRLTVVQPRFGSGAPQTVTVPHEQLDQHAERIRALDADGELHDGPHCRFCPAAPTCPQLVAVAQRAAALDFAEDPLATLTWLLEHKEQLETLLESVPKQVIAHMQQGTKFAGWKVIRGKGNRHWIIDETEVLKRLRARKVGKKLATETRLRSPAQLEKAGFGEQIADLVTRSDTGYRVVRETASGEAVSFETAAETFDDMPF